MKPKVHPFLRHSLALAVCASILAMSSAHGQTHYFDVNGTTAGSGVADAGSYDWHGAFWADDNTGIATTSNKGWGATGNSVVFASTADIVSNSYTVTLPGGFIQTWVKNITVNSGNLSIFNNSLTNFVLGATSTWTVASGSSLSINPSGASWRAVNMNDSSLILDTQGTATASIAGLNNGSGTLTKTGGGTLTLTDNNNYSGDTTISAGTLNIGNGGNNGSLYSAAVSAGNLTFGSAGAIVNNSALAYNIAGGYVAVNQTISGTGTLSVTGDQSIHFAAGTSITTDGSQIYSATATGSRYHGFNFADGATVALTSTAGDISMTGYLGTANESTGNLFIDTSTNNGNITLNTPTGMIGVDFGMNSLSADAGTGAISLGTHNGQNWITCSSISLAGGTINSTANLTDFTNLNVANSGASTFSGDLTAVGGSLIKDSTGTLALTGAASYGGTTTVNEGTLILGDGTNNVGLSDTSDLIVESGASLQLNYGVGSPDSIDELWLGGVQQNAGTYSAGTYSGVTITGTGLLNVINGPITDPFANWMTTNYPAIVSPANAPGADPDNDGIANLMEYVLQGGDPSVSTTGTLPTLDTTGANFVFTYFRRAAATGTTQTFKHSTTLGAGSWTPVAIPGGPGVTVADQGGGIDKVEITVAKGSNTKLFGRLQLMK